MRSYRVGGSATLMEKIKVYQREVWFIFRRNVRDGLIHGEDAMALGPKPAHGLSLYRMVCIFLNRSGMWAHLSFPSIQRRPPDGRKSHQMEGFLVPKRLSGVDFPTPNSHFTEM